jgi:hypothetical protein
LHQQLDGVEVREHLGERGREPVVVHDGACTAVTEEVAQLVGHVPVVDVERGHACLERTQHAGQVLDTVQEVESEMVLA